MRRFVSITRQCYSLMFPTLHFTLQIYYLQSTRKCCLLCNYNTIGMYLNMFFKPTSVKLFWRQVIDIVTLRSISDYLYLLHFRKTFIFTSHQGYLCALVTLKKKKILQPNVKCTK